jgi:hypothetical protein
MIDMVLHGGAPSDVLYHGQSLLEPFLLFLATVSAPWMLLAKPLHLHYMHWQDKHGSSATFVNWIVGLVTARVPSNAHPLRRKSSPTVNTEPAWTENAHAAIAGDGGGSIAMVPSQPNNGGVALTANGRSTFSELRATMTSQVEEPDWVTSNGTTTVKRTVFVDVHIPDSGSSGDLSKTHAAAVAASTTAASAPGYG